MVTLASSIHWSASLREQIPVLLMYLLRLTDESLGEAKLEILDERQKYSKAGVLAKFVGLGGSLRSCVVLTAFAKVLSYSSRRDLLYL